MSDTAKTLTDLPAPDDRTAWAVLARLDIPSDRDLSDADLPLGENLRAARRAQGLKSEQVALAIGKSVYSVHSYENGRVSPPAHVLVSLSRLLGVSVDSLLGLEE